MLRVCNTKHSRDRRKAPTTQAARTERAGAQRLPLHRPTRHLINPGRDIANLRGDPTLVVILFWSAAAALLWTYLLFPLGMILRGQRASRDSHPAPGVRAGLEPTVTVVLAARNEEHALPVRIENLLTQDYPAERLDILIVCNACTDGTVPAAQRIAEREPRVNVLVSSGEEGKAGALNLGVSKAGGEIIVFADCRQRFAPDAVHQLVEGLSDPAVGAVSGRLLIGEAATAAVQGVGIYWHLESRLRSAQARTGSVMGATGAIYAVRRELYTPVPPNLILDDVFIPMQVLMRGRRVGFRPEALAFDSASTATGSEFHRKLRTMTGNIEILRVMPELLSPWKNPYFFRYLSHKVLRIASPILLFVVVLTALVLPLWPYGILASGVVGLLAVGLLGLLLPLRLLALPAAFLVVQVAAAMAILRPGRGAGALWSAPPAAPSAGAAPHSS
jgi:cellulose synthase/poly-beta-1,6-N-acetylglucosamine synthase-like glycosyltransferase